MGFFSKIFKGVKKVFKKIGKGIKSAFKKFGKFMNKIGILGQVAMFFVMPYVGAALGSMWTGIAGQTAAQTASTAAGAAVAQAATTAGATATAAATAGATAAANTASTIAAGQAVGATAAQVSASTVALGTAKATGLMAGNAVARGVGHVMQFTANTVSKVGTVFNNITKGVTDTLGNFAKTASNKMFGTSFDAASNFFGAGDSAFSRSFGDQSRFQNLTSSESVFENFKKDRLAETEAKLSTRSGQKAMEQAVAESGGDSRAYGQTDFIADPNIEQAIGRGDTNLTASLDPTIQDPQALANNAFQPDVSEVLDSLKKPPEYKFSVNPDQLPSLDYNVDAPSLLERLKTGVEGIPDAITKKAGEIADDPLGYAFKGTEESLQKQMNLRVGQELGILEKPEYNVQNVSNVAYVPSMDSFASPQSQYGAPEIMDARAFEQQVTFNPNPYGYTAFQYGNYMSQFGQTA